MLRFFEKKPEPVYQVINVLLNSKANEEAEYSLSELISNISSKNEINGDIIIKLN